MPTPVTAFAPQIPVTVLTGYLGAGKTTLLDRILDMEPDFLSGAADHEHDDAVASVSLTLDRPVGSGRF